MIGDLVLSPTITPVLHVCRVVDVCGYRECVGLYDIADEDQYMICKNAKHLEPIPLTEEILIKNGFYKGSYVGGYLHKDFLFRVYPVDSEFPPTSFVYEESPIDETVFLLPLRPRTPTRSPSMWAERVGRQFRCKVKICAQGKDKERKDGKERLWQHSSE